MKKYVIILLTCGLLVGCNSKQSEEEPKKKDPTPTEEIATQDPSTEQADQPVSKPSLSKAEIALLKIPTTPIESPFDEDGNIKFEHDEIEFVKEYMDERGRIYFNLDEQPIRSITSGENGNITNVTNYGDTFIDMMEAEAYGLSNQPAMDSAYQLFITNPPAELAGKDPSEYRTWEEATNLERGIMQMIYLMAPSLNSIGYFSQQNDYENEAFKIMLEDFEKLGSPSVMVPAPQTPLDLQLFENMKMVQAMWGQLGQFNDPKNNQEAFQQLYTQVRNETNNIIVRVNYTLSEKLEAPNNN
ncbi:hypothetical protein [Bacillus sp. CGMCC 1.16541]|uniref:hypothetical protein n=1 Tax=Bacillus sp. CGMCC 1.16541 TaxID=2185143 RepID=UPI000D734D61|nr:hypothetical protein [Bacillus sp. CGMCC 1.16541]